MSPKRTAYVQNRAKGMTRKQSAINAGIADTAGNYQDKAVQYELARVRAEMAADANITREDVVAMLVDAADMARMMSDPTAMIAAAREIGKILGHYAPEIKKIVRGMDQGEVKKAIEGMSDEELLKLANARVKVIDGESTRIKSVPALPSVRADEGAEAETPVLQETSNMS